MNVDYTHQKIMFLRVYDPKTFLKIDIIMTLCQNNTSNFTPSYVRSELFPDFKQTAPKSG